MYSHVCMVMVNNLSLMRGHLLWVKGQTVASLEVLLSECGLLVVGEMGKSVVLEVRLTCSQRIKN